MTFYHTSKLFSCIYNVYVQNVLVCTIRIVVLSKPSSIDTSASIYISILIE